MSRWNEYLDLIRISPRKQEDVYQDSYPCCEHAGCREAGVFRAPKGRLHEGIYLSFCDVHIKDYNRRYNYFDGMSDEDLFVYQEQAKTGHRPTWGMGERTSSRAQSYARRTQEVEERLRHIFRAGEERYDQHTQNRQAQRPPVRNAERQAFGVLNLDVDATADEIRVSYKLLAKRLHPDLNQGDRSSEEQLKAVIDAYNYLKKQGFC